MFSTVLEARLPTTQTIASFRCFYRAHARVRPLRLPGRRALAQLASTYISAACLIFMGIGQGVVALLWREWGAFEANVLANVDVILKYDNSQI